MGKVISRKFVLILCLVLITLIGSFFIFLGDSIEMIYELRHPKIERNQDKVLSIIIEASNEQLGEFKINNSFSQTSEIYALRKIDGYKVEMTTQKNFFEIWAIPLEYGKTGKTSYYLDSRVGRMQGADHQGEKANENDPVIIELPDETKNQLINISKSL